MGGGGTFDLGALETEAGVSVGGFLIMIVFILGFDFMTKFLEFVLEDSPRYNRMVQNIYKELMQMGVISFVFVLFQSGAPPASLSSPWTTSLDFAHVLLFFVAIYFVVHTFYLIGVSVRTSNLYARLAAENAYELVTQKSQCNPFDNFFFNLSFLPNTFREKFEFKILHILFRDVFSRLPEDFSFHLYLSKSFEQYSLKIMEFGIFSWIVLLLLVLVNYVRLEIYGALHCKGHEHECADTVIGILQVLAVSVTFYIVLIMLMCRVYEIRLVQFMGISSASEYDEFLQFISREERAELMKKSVNGVYTEHFTSNDLKKIVEEFVDAKENNEENHMYRYISSSWETFLIRVNDIKYSILMWYRLRRRKVNPDMSMSQRRKPSILNKQPSNDDIVSGSTSTNMAREAAKKKEKERKERKRSMENESSMANSISLAGGDNKREKIQATLQTRKVATKNKTNNSAPIFKSFKSKESSSHGNEGNGNVSSKLGESLPRFLNIRSKESSKPDLATNPNKVGASAGANDNSNDNDPMSNQGSLLKRTQSKRAAEEFNKTIRGNSMTRMGDSVPAKPLPEHNHMQSSKGKSSKLATPSSKDIPKTMMEKYKNYKERGNCNVTVMGSTGGPRSFFFKETPQDEKHFSDIFFLGKPSYFFRAVEVALMANSLFLALGSYFTQPLLKVGSNYWFIYVAFPMFITFPCIGRIVKVASMLKAITELQLEVIRDVIIESDDMKTLSNELRDEILSRLDGVHEKIMAPATNKRMENAATALKQDVIHRLFQEIDVDGNGVVDKVEFRNLLTLLQLTYSDKRFQRLFKAVDVKAKGKLGIADLEALLFPPQSFQQQTATHVQRRRSEMISNNDLSRGNSFNTTDGAPALIQINSKRFNADGFLEAIVQEVVESHVGDLDATNSSDENDDDDDDDEDENGEYNIHGKRRSQSKKMAKHSFEQSFNEQTSKPTLVDHDKDEMAQHDEGLMSNLNAIVSTSTKFVSHALQSLPRVTSNRSAKSFPGQLTSQRSTKSVKSNKSDGNSIRNSKNNQDFVAPFEPHPMLPTNEDNC